MNEKTNQKKKVLILVLVLGLVLLTVGTTFAFFTYSKQGVEEHILTTGSLYFVYDELPNEEDSNKISISNAFPVSDDKGMEQDKPGMFEFEVRAKTQGADINYEIYLTKDESSTLPEKVIDTYLTTTGKKGENAQETLVKPTWDNKWTKDNGVTQYQFLWNSHVPALEEGQQGKSLYQETIKDTEGQEYSKVFRYRMWLDESAEGVNAKGEWIYGGKSFTVRVNVYASNEEIPSPTPVGVMQSWTYKSYGSLPETDFHSSDYVDGITSIRFANKIEEPEETIEQWDISAAEDGSVMAYAFPTADQNSVEIVIAANGDVYGNPNSSFAFFDFYNLEHFDSTNFNTGLIENTGGMFADCFSLTSLDLGNWDTFGLKTVFASFTTNFSLMSAVPTDYGMFEGCEELGTITGIEKWDTSNVTDMSHLFYGCSQLSDLSSISNWDTSSVTGMYGMFSGCSQLSSVGDLSGWDTSNVTGMSGMFSDCSQLSTLDLSKWDTTNVTNMSGMFFNCSQLSDFSFLEHWDTSDVKSMNFMFNGCSQLETLDLSKWDTSNVTDMSYMFEDCSQLTTIYVKDESARQWFIDNAGSMRLDNPYDVVKVKTQ